MRGTLLVSLLIAVIAVIFTLANSGETMGVNLVFADAVGSKALVLIVTFAVGVIVGILATLPAYFRNRRKVNSLQKTIADERSEVRRQREQRPASSEQPAPDRSRDRSEEPPPPDASSETS